MKETVLFSVMLRCVILIRVCPPWKVSWFPSASCYCVFLMQFSTLKLWKVNPLH